MGETMMDKENLHREKEQAYMKGYEDGAEKMRDFMREQLATANLNCEKAFHEGYLQGKHEEEMDKVFGGIEAIKPTKTPTDLISRQAAIEAIEVVSDEICQWQAVETIVSLPPVEPERPKGEWEHGRELSRVFIGDALRGINYEDWHCSNCHCVVEQSIKPKWSYCPNCGADMRGDKE